MPARVEIRGTAEFRETAAKLKAAGDGRLRREMTRNMREAAQPVIGNMRRAVLGTSAAGTRGGGGQARREYLLSRARKRSELIQRRAYEGRGLRASAAATVKAKVATSATSASVRIKSQASLMPPDQRKLPRAMNKGKWRHPVFGSRNRWAGQTVTPVAWFDRPAAIGGPRVRDKAVKVVDEINRKIVS
ncbi:hypothetical protein [Actinophytocola sediminis]